MKFVDIVKPKTTWKKDNYLAWVAGIMFAVSVTFLWAGKMQLDAIRLPPEKCYTVAGCIWVLVGTLWLACAVLLSKEAKSTLRKPLIEPAQEFNLAAVADLTSRGISEVAQAKHAHDSAVAEGFWPAFRGWFSIILGANANSPSRGLPSTDAARLDVLERQIEGLTATVKILTNETRARSDFDKVFTHQVRGKIEALSEAVLGAAHNVFLGALYVIFGTVLLMVEVFWQDARVRDVFCPESNWKCKQLQTSTPVSDTSISSYLGSHARNSPPATHTATAATVPT
jgi:hypothetical protein